MLNVTWYPYPYYDIENPEPYNWNIHLKPSRQESQYDIIQHAVMTTPTLGMYIFLRAYSNDLECCYNALYVYTNKLSIRTRTKVIRRKHIIQPTGFSAYSSICFLWDGEDVAAPWELLHSHPPIQVQKPLRKIDPIKYAHGLAFIPIWLSIYIAR